VKPVDGTYLLLDANMYKGYGLVLEAQGRGLQPEWIEKMREWPGYIWIDKCYDEFTESNDWYF
jgi:hypothetical protein